ncbi:hypothetical protein Tco_1141235 [Tanacetum coccineum]
MISEILKKRPLKDALTLYAPSPTIYLQQFWYTVHKVQDEKEVIIFKTEPRRLTSLLILFSIGYVGQLEFVTKFLVKNLPQPWQTLFKVLNRCTTSKMMGFDQSKINTLQIFYAIVNQHNVDFAQLIWTYFLAQEYVGDYRRLYVLMIQPPPVVSTKGTHRTLSAPRSPEPKSTSKKLNGKVVGESSKLRKPLKIKLKYSQPTLIIFMFKEKQAIAEVDDAILTKQVEQMVTREDVEANTFVDTMMLSQPDPCTSIDQEEKVG